MIEIRKEGERRTVRTRLDEGFYRAQGKTVILHCPADVDEIQEWRDGRGYERTGWHLVSYTWETAVPVPRVPWYRRWLGLGPKNSLPFAKAIT